jgi:phosphoribosyl-ATP pyrophosphohydrolase/phosphoribosyl-AMP cyclohydrolase/histidinol dehydrogenase
VSSALPRKSPAEIQSARREPVDAATLAQADQIVAAVRSGGASSARALGERFGDVAAGAPMVLGRDAMAAAWHRVGENVQGVLSRTAQRIRDFATAQRQCLRELSTLVPGGLGGHFVAPVASAGCYAPGGRYPLPSSVLMTAVTAHAAGVDRVVVASPKPGDVTLAAAYVAGADALLAIGGAHAVASLAYGLGGELAPVDLIVGPGNRWVTAAKKIVSGVVGIDMLAGPSELVVLADDSASPATIAADLLAQAEHDEDASAFLVTTSPALADGVAREVDRQLESLPTAATARVALGRGGAVVCASREEALRVVDALAPEHLQIFTRDPASDERALKHYGAVFLGEMSAEVMGDYGIGPNHVLPTGGTARFSAGLSVFTFLRVRTWLRLSTPEAAADAATLARLEGLEAHARAAEQRLR